MTTNYIITKGNIVDQLKYSLFKLLDWSIGHAVCIYQEDDGGIWIDDCKLSLQKKLTEAIGGTCSGKIWGIEPQNTTNISDVIKIVTEWVKEQ